MKGTLSGYGQKHRYVPHIQWFVVILIEIGYPIYEQNVGSPWRIQSYSIHKFKISYICIYIYFCLWDINTWHIYILCYTLYYIIFYSILLYYIMLYYIILYCIILYCIILYCIVLYYIILYYNIYIYIFDYLMIFPSQVRHISHSLAVSHIFFSDDQQLDIQHPACPAEFKTPGHGFPLVMTNSSPWKPWPIEIDDFPGYKPPFVLGIFHGYVSHNQRVTVILTAIFQFTSSSFRSICRIVMFALQPRLKYQN